MLTQDEKVHADLEIFEDEDLMPQLNAAATAAATGIRSNKDHHHLAPRVAPEELDRQIEPETQISQVLWHAEGVPSNAAAQTVPSEIMEAIGASAPPALQTVESEAEEDHRRPAPEPHQDRPTLTLTTPPAPAQTTVAPPNQDTSEEEDPDLILDDEIDLGIGSASIFSFGAGPTFDERADDIIVEETDPEPETSQPLDIIRIHIKAARLVAMLPRSRELQRVYQRKMVSILSEFPHGSSVLAIERMISEGATIDFIEDCAQLKILWRDSPHLWLYIALPRAGAGDKFIPKISASNRSLSWTTAAHILETYPLTDALAMIETDWIEDWRRLHKHTSQKLEADAFSYQAFLRNRTPEFRMRDADDWPYEEIVDTVRHSDLCYKDGFGQELWRFDPNAPGRTGVSHALACFLKPNPYRNNHASE